MATSKLEFINKKIVQAKIFAGENNNCKHKKKTVQTKKKTLKREIPKREFSRTFQISRRDLFFVNHASNIC